MIKDYANVHGEFGTSIKVQKSTLHPMKAWLFVRNSPNGSVKGAVHLNRDQAKELHAALSDFLGDF